jgi:transposase
VLKIRQEITENPSGWHQAKQVIDIIYKKTGVKYHEVYIYRLLHKWGFSANVPMKRFVNTSSKEEEKERPSKRNKKGNTRKSQKDSIQ